MKRERHREIRAKFGDRRGKSTGQIVKIEPRLMVIALQKSDIMFIRNSFCRLCYELVKKAKCNDFWNRIIPANQ